MRPFLRGGDIVYLEEVPLEDVDVGDILLFRPSPDTGSATLHRVIQKKRGADGAALFTKGDAAQTADRAAIDREALLGRVIARERRGKRVEIRGSYRRIVSALAAFLSSLNVTPGILKKRIFDPLLDRFSKRLAPLGRIVISVLKQKVEYVYFRPNSIRAEWGGVVLGAIELDEYGEGEKREYRISRFWVKHIGTIIGAREGLIQHAKHFARENRAVLRQGPALQE